MRSITEDKSGQMMIIGILFLFMTITVMIAMIPALKEILNIAKQSDNLNCVSFAYSGDATHTLSYNSSLDTDTASFKKYAALFNSLNLSNTCNCLL